jgi:hypothetical protein
MLQRVGLRQCYADIVHDQQSRAILLEERTICSHPMPKTYKLYAAMHADIAEGFVWLKDPKLPSRCIVKIRYAKKGKPVFCEALQFEENFCSLYNKKGGGRCEIKEESQDSSIVMNHWYRARLGGPENPLKTCKTHPEGYSLEIEKANRWWGKFRSCIGHPQIVVRLSAWLAFWSVALG